MLNQYLLFVLLVSLEFRVEILFRNMTMSVVYFRHIQSQLDSLGLHNFECLLDDVYGQG